MPRTGWGEMDPAAAADIFINFRLPPRSFTAQTLTLTWTHEIGKCTDLWRRKQVAIIKCDDCNQQDILASSRVNVLRCGCFHHKINLLLGLCVKRLTTMQSKIKIHLVIKWSIKWRPEDFICGKTKLRTKLKQNNSRAGLCSFYCIFRWKHDSAVPEWPRLFEAGVTQVHLCVDSCLATRTLKNRWNRCSQSWNAPCLCDSLCHFLKASQWQDAACSLTGSSPLSQMS